MLSHFILRYDMLFILWLLMLFTLFYVYDLLFYLLMLVYNVKLITCVLVIQ